VGQHSIASFHAARLRSPTAFDFLNTGRAAQFSQGRVEVKNAAADRQIPVAQIMDRALQCRGGVFSTVNKLARVIQNKLHWPHVETPGRAASGRSLRFAAGQYLFVERQEVKALLAGFPDA
jgi:hypothetical protein